MKKSSNSSNSRNNSYNNKPHGRKGSNKPKFDNEAKQRVEQNAEARISASHNNISFWNRNPEMFEAAANFQFSYPAGYYEDLYPLYSNGTTTGQKLAFNTPGVCVLEIVPTIGTAATSNSPANRAAAQAFGKNRAANSGQTNYDSNDFMLYIMAVGQVYSAINWLELGYGLANKFDAQDYYKPETLVRALGFQFDDLKKNKADFRYAINQLIDTIEAFRVPAGFEFFNRWAMLYHSLYREGTSAKDQLYMFAPRAFLQFSYDSDSAGMLKPVDVATVDQKMTGDGALTWEQAVGIVDRMVKAIYDEGSHRIMSGDVEKAFPNHMVSLAHLAEDIEIDVSFDIQMLEQIKNARVIPLDIASLEIVQSADKGMLTSTPKITIARRDTPQSTAGELPLCGISTYTSRSRMFGYPAVITTTTKDVSREVVVENTRLLAMFRVTNNSLSGTVWSGDLICSGDVAVGVELWTYNAAGTAIPTVYDWSYVCDWIAADITMPINVSRCGYTSPAGHTNFDSIRSTFDFAPMLVQTLSIASKTAPSSNVDLNIGANTFKLIGDVDNYTIQGWSQMARLHEMCMLSLFNLQNS